MEDHMITTLVEKKRVLTIQARGGVCSDQSVRTLPCVSNSEGICLAKATMIAVVTKSEQNRTIREDQGRRIYDREKRGHRWIIGRLHVAPAVSLAMFVSYAHSLDTPWIWVGTQAWWLFLPRVEVYIIPIPITCLIRPPEQVIAVVEEYSSIGSLNRMYILHLSWHCSLQMSERASYPML